VFAEFASSVQDAELNKGLSPTAPVILTIVPLVKPPGLSHLPRTTKSYAIDAVTALLTNDAVSALIACELLNALVAYDAVPSKEPVIPFDTCTEPVTITSLTNLACGLYTFKLPVVISTLPSKVVLPVTDNGPDGKLTVPNNVCVSFDASPNWFEPLEYITDAVS